ncbi:hypothetical protein C5167_025472 [Papaver somniferum]|uniref:Uncharacterized protein n=1 Tax=Papaver somniferum TaxID=3469 RepID=A0A4Y7JVB6_PAPSO|nr:hypothetical protein C5167_025472 [Papaver somniferum]
MADKEQSVEEDSKSSLAFFEASQHNCIGDLEDSNSRNSKSVERVPLPPPLYSAAAENSSCTKPSPSPSRSFKQSSAPYYGPKPSVGTAPHASFSDFDNKYKGNKKVPPPILVANSRGKYSDKLEPPMYFPNFPDMN